MAVARSLTHSFAHVRAYRSVEGWGVHFLAAQEPFEAPDVDEFLQRMPEAARADLVEWNGAWRGGRLREIRPFVEQILSQEISVQRLLHPDPRVVINDDRPFNEYFLLRGFFKGMWQAPIPAGW